MNSLTSREHLKWHGVKVGSGPRDLGPRDSETRDRGSLPLQNLKVRPGTYLKFKSRTTGSPSKLKSGTLIIIFPHCLTYFVLGKLILLYVIWNNFPQIVGILSYIICSELIHHFREIFNVTVVGLMQRRNPFFFGGGWRDPCSLSGVQLARQFIKLNSFICLTYHLSDNLKIWHKFSPMTYTNLRDRTLGM